MEEWRQCVEFIYQIVATLTIVITFIYTISKDRIKTPRVKTEILNDKGYKILSEEDGKLFENIFFHLNVFDANKHSVGSKLMNVFLKEVTIENNNGEEAYRISVNSILKWRHQEGHDIDHDIYYSFECDFFRIKKTYNQKQSFEFCPMRIRTQDLKGAEGFINTYPHHNIYCSIIVNHQKGVSQIEWYKIRWDGLWNPDIEIMNQHLQIDKVKRRAR